MASFKNAAEKAVHEGDGRALTHIMDQKMRTLLMRGQGKTHQANFDKCKPFKAGMSNLNEFTTALFFELRKPKGGAQLEMRVHEENYLEHGLMPPKDILESAVHHFTARDADTDTLEAMLAAGELEGGDIAFARP